MDYRERMLDILVQDLLRVQFKIYLITKKYDDSTTIENYQEKSIKVLNKMSKVDRLKMRWYANRTNLILEGMNI